MCQACNLGLTATPAGRRSIVMLAQSPVQQLVMLTCCALQAERESQLQQMLQVEQVPRLGKQPGGGALLLIHRPAQLSPVVPQQATASEAQDAATALQAADVAGTSGAEDDFWADVAEHLADKPGPGGCVAQAAGLGGTKAGSSAVQQDLAIQAGSPASSNPAKRSESCSNRQGLTARQPLPPPKSQLQRKLSSPKGEILARRTSFTSR